MFARPVAYTLVCLCLVLQGCASFLLPKAHRHPMQQGNLIDKEQRALLREGMTVEQVRYLVGNPTLIIVRMPISPLASSRTHRP